MEPVFVVSWWVRAELNRRHSDFQIEFLKKLAKRKPLIFGLISRYINYLGPTSQFHLFPSIL
jgi:hypothetical protein